MSGSSYSLVPDAVVRGERPLPGGAPLSPGARCLFHLYTDYSRNGESICTASQETLAGHLNVDVSTVRRWRDELCEARLIGVQHRGAMRTDEVTPLWTFRDANDASDDRNASDVCDASDAERMPHKGDNYFEGDNYSGEQSNNGAVVPLPREVSPQRVCALSGCENSLDGVRAGTRYCKPAHRQAAHRQRLAERERAVDAAGMPPGTPSVTVRGGAVTGLRGNAASVEARAPGIAPHGVRPAAAGQRAAGSDLSAAVMPAAAPAPSVGPGESEAERELERILEKFPAMAAAR